MSLLEAVGIADDLDDGIVQIDQADVKEFAELCRDLRFWQREERLES